MKINTPENLLDPKHLPFMLMCIPPRIEETVEYSKAHLMVLPQNSPGIMDSWFCLFGLNGGCCCFRFLGGFLTISVWNFSVCNSTTEMKW